MAENDHQTRKRWSPQTAQQYVDLMELAAPFDLSEEESNCHDDDEEIWRLYDEMDAAFPTLEREIGTERATPVRKALDAAWQALCDGKGLSVWNEELPKASDALREFIGYRDNYVPPRR